MANAFGVIKYASRGDARSIIVPILDQNKEIFRSYGPETSEQFNPESDRPKVWLRKIREHILPNNRKLLAILDTNISLLNSTELTVLEQFRQHVDDFEAKHIGGSDVSGRQFPVEMNEILGI